MNLGALKRAVTLVLLGSALLFLVVLFLDWHRATVSVFREGNAAAGSSGWSGWGILAGFFALALVVLEGDRIRRKRTHEGEGVLDLVLAVGLSLGTIAAVFTAEETLWPAWVGLALASMMVAAAAVVAALPVRSRMLREHRQI